MLKVCAYGTLFNNSVAFPARPNFNCFFPVTEVIIKQHGHNKVFKIFTSRVKNSLYLLIAKKVDLIGPPF